MNSTVGVRAGILLLFISAIASFGQSDRGKIIKTASSVLDPNGDGFVSKTNAGFSFDGYYVDEFEIKMFSVPQLTGDVTGDNIGKNCGITDLIPDNKGHSVYARRDNNNNLIFRFRVGDNNPSVEAWTILLDTDGKFGTNDPNATANNPGFEIDITFIKNSNKGVMVYNIDGIESCPTAGLTYPFSTHFQISIADEVTCGDPDYFYDFYVPFAQVAAAFGIDENTGLRYAAVTNVSATCAMAGKIADISGVDYNLYKDCIPCAFTDLINNQCPTPVVNLCETCPGFTSDLVAAPTIDTPVRAGQLTVSGTSQSGIYITVKIYSRVGGTDASPTWSSTPRETKSAYANGTIWGVTLTGPLQSYDKIVAKAQLTENSVPCGGDGDNTASTSVTVVQPNDRPVANNQNISTPEDTPVAIILTGSDPNNDPITFNIVSNPTHGVLTGTLPNLTYTPNPDYNGSDSFSFNVSDGIYSATVAGVVSITVSPVNDKPVANNQSVTVIEDTPKSIVLSGSDIDGDALTYTVQTQPLHGTLTGTGSNRTYSPAPNYFGADSFTFLVNDGTVNSAIATVSINVNAVNDAPVANDQAVTVTEDVAKVITLIGSDVEGNPLSYIIVSSPLHGTLVGSGANRTYTPVLNYNGPDNFTFKVNDGSVDSNIATVTITVTPVNDAPIANSQSITTDEDVAKGITLTGIDVDGNPLTFSIQTPPAHGALSGSAPNLIYTPAANYNGSDVFTFSVSDGMVTSNLAQVFITVLPVADAPIANDQNLTTPEDTSLPITLTGNDPDGSAITYVLVSSPVNGTLSGSGANRTYVPNPNFNGSDSFTFKVNDGSGDSNIATISITVSPINDAPIANNQSVSTNEDVAKAIILTGTDVDGNPLTFTVQTTPAHGTLSGSAPNVTYTPNSNFNGSDVFTFSVDDGTLTSNVAQVVITIVPMADAPIADNQNLSTDEDTSLPITLTGNDPDGSTITYILVSLPSNGTLTGSGANLNYLPDLNFNGSDAFTFKVNDGSGDSNTATISITVNAVNDAPIANNMTVAYAANAANPFTLLASDVDGNPLTYAVLTVPTTGTITGTEPNLTFNSPASGVYTLTFRVNDGAINSNTATVTFVLGDLANVAPTASGQIVVTNEDIPVAITLIADDEDGDPLTYEIVSGPTNGTLLGTMPNITYRPNLNYAGPDEFVFRVHDDFGTPEYSGNAMVSITVNAVNDLPIANPQSVTTPEDVAVIVTLTGSDVEGPVSYTIAAMASHGSLVGSANTYTYTPNLDYFGSDSFTFFVTDNSSIISTNATVSITVTSVDDNPMAMDDLVGTDEDTPITFNVTSNDTDSEGIIDVTTVDLNPGTIPLDNIFIIAGQGKFEVNLLGEVTFTPELNYNGTTTPIPYTTKDNTGLISNQATISVVVNPINDLPFAHAQSITLLEDASTLITLTGTDVETNVLSFTIVTQPTNGVLSGSGATITYTPNPDYFGSDSFTFKVNDGTVDSEAATVLITVESVNDLPVAVADVIATDEDTPVTINLTQNDYDVDGTIDPSTVDLDPSTLAEDKTLTIAGEGTYTVDLNGNVTFTPILNFNGSTTPISYSVKDNETATSSSSGTISVTVRPINDAPEPQDATVAVDEDSNTQICITVVDVENDPVVITDLSSINGNGTITLQLGTLCFNYSPTPDFNGQDIIVVTVCDANDPSLCNTATITININPVNDAPIVIVDNQPKGELVYTTQEDVPLDFCFDAIDVDGDITSIEAFNGVVVGGSLMAQPTGIGNRFCFRFEPSPNFNGQASWSLSACDNGNLCAPLIIIINVSPENDAPVAEDQSVELNEDESKDIILTAVDVDADVLSYALNSNPVHGTAILSGATVTYTPAANYFGDDSFTFTANDGIVTSNIAAVTIKVLPVNDAPVIRPLTINSKEDSVLQVCLSVIDIDGDEVTFKEPNNLSGGGSMTPDAVYNFCFIYTPDLNYNGYAVWEMKVCDSQNLCGTAEVAILMIPVNDPPIAVDDYAEAQAGTALDVDVLENDLIIEAPFSEFYDIYATRDSTDILSLVKIQTFGSFAEIKENKISYSADLNFVDKTDSIWYWIKDKGGLIDSAVVYIEVGPAKFHIFEAVSPNGDGVNDYWRINGIEQDHQNVVRVFDRFNNMVFETTGYSNESNNWYGQSTHGVAQGNVPEGTYYYTISIDLSEDNEGLKLFSGYVVLKRN